VRALHLFDPAPFTIVEETHSFECLVCGADTNTIDEYYALHDDVWRSVNPDVAGMLCIGCVEARLGRSLTRDDFTTSPVNRDSRWPRSDRLVARLAA
jgi:hypothetical protein